MSKEHQPKVQDQFKVQTKPRVSVASVNTNDASAQSAAPVVEANAKSMPDISERATLADSNSLYQRIDAKDLPSKGLFYEFEALSIRKFFVPDLKKIYRARATGNFRTLAEVLQATIDRDLFQMTTGDFWYLMYWHRVNSYLSAPLDITWTCSDDQHLKDVEEGKKTPESLEGRVTLNKSNMQVSYVDDETAIAELIGKVFTEYEGITLFPTRLIDLIENIEMMDGLSGLESITEVVGNDTTGDTPAVALKVAKNIAKNIDEEWLNDYVGILHPMHGSTTQEKREFFTQVTEEKGYGFALLSDMDEFTALTAHGVQETVSTKCKGCGATSEGKISASALDFFPGI